MGRELLIATTNPDKLKEIVGVFAGSSITLKSLAEFPDIDIPDENGSTFEENARQKALHYSRATRLLTMAEDSGFEVDELDGQPGIYSARFLRPDASYPERFEAIYFALRQRHLTASTARFVCALALAADGRILFEIRTTVEGLLAARPAGNNGFGYDPIFLFPPYGRTFGEVSSQDKLAVSHRGKAIRALRAHLQDSL